MYAIKYQRSKITSVFRFKAFVSKIQNKICIMDVCLCNACVLIFRVFSSVILLQNNVEKNIKNSKLTDIIIFQVERHMWLFT